MYSKKTFWITWKRSQLSNTPILRLWITLVITILGTLKAIQITIKRLKHKQNIHLSWY